MKNYDDLPYIHDAFDELYWGLMGGELRDITPIGIYEYVNAFLSSALNRPAPIDEIARVIVDAYEATLISYEMASDDEYLPILLKIEEAWLMVETEANVPLPPELRFETWHELILRQCTLRRAQTNGAPPDGEPADDV